MIYPHLYRVLNDPNSKFWVNFTHDPAKLFDERLGNSLEMFFTKTLNKKVTTTMMRMLMETNAELMFRQGKLASKILITIVDSTVTYSSYKHIGIFTLDQRESIRNINGHNSATTDDHYLALDRKRDGDIARTLFSSNSQAQGQGQGQGVSPSKSNVSSPSKVHGHQGQGRLAGTYPMFMPPPPPPPSASSAFASTYVALPPAPTPRPQTAADVASATIHQWASVPLDDDLQVRP